LCAQAREAAEAAASETARQLAASDREAGLQDNELEQMSDTLGHVNRQKQALEAKLRNYELVRWPHWLVSEAPKPNYAVASSQTLKCWEDFAHAIACVITLKLSKQHGDVPAPAGWTYDAQGELRWQPGALCCRTASNCRHGSLPANTPAAPSRR